MDQQKEQLREALKNKKIKLREFFETIDGDITEKRKWFNQTTNQLLVNLWFCERTNEGKILTNIWCSDDDTDNDSESGTSDETETQNSDPLHQYIDELKKRYNNDMMYILDTLSKTHLKFLNALDAIKNSEV